ncbi:MAG: hypothetical protein O2854_10260 [Chloroflexi bacterium]|nr:hypothetical protein [Chloroflexota bacterium]
MEKLMDIVDKAIADYGFRQSVAYSPEDVAVTWGLTSQEAHILMRIVRPQLEILPVPVEPANQPKEHARFVLLIEQALKK